MKKVFITLFASAIVGMAMAQDVNTYSVYDVNQSGDITIADVTETVNQVKSSAEASSTQQYVTADDLSTLLKDIQSKLNQMDDIISELKLIKEKLNIDDSDEHEYVDLGLSVKWAKTNVGADTETDAGLYFAWGETTGYTSDTSDGHSFDWSNYSLCSGSESSMTKYCTSESYGTVDNATSLLSADDAATSKWGSSWRIPTQEEWLELCDTKKCTWTWDSTNKGYKVTGTNGNSIFLPAAGYRCGGNIGGVGTYGYYWSSNLYEETNSSAYYEYFSSGEKRASESKYRFYGQPVRAVYSK